MRLGAAHFGRNARPLRADAGQVQAVESISRTASPILRRNPRVRHGPACLEQLRENTAGHACGWRPRTSSASAPPRPNDRVGLDGSPSWPRSRERGRPGQLAEKQRDELLARREPAHQVVAPCSSTSLSNVAPRNEFENIVENAILVSHGVDPFRVQSSRQTLWNRDKINAVRPSTRCIKSSSAAARKSIKALAINPMAAANLERRMLMVTTSASGRSCPHEFGNSLAYRGRSLL